MDLFQSIAARAMGATPLLWPRPVSRFSAEPALFESSNFAEPEQPAMPPATAAALPAHASMTGPAQPIAPARMQVQMNPPHAEPAAPAVGVLHAIQHSAPEKAEANGPAPAAPLPGPAPQVRAQPAPVAWPAPVASTVREQPSEPRPAGRIAAPASDPLSPPMPAALAPSLQVQGHTTEPLPGIAAPPHTNVPLLVPHAPALVRAVAERAPVRAAEATAGASTHQDESGPVIQVTIGRVEVRALTTSPAERQEAARPRRVSLDDYLRRRPGSES